MQPEHLSQTDEITKSDNPVVQEQLAETYKKEPVPYSNQEIKFRDELIWQLCLARDWRDRKHPEADDMTYIEYYESNKRKDLSYLPPKRNKQDVRIVTGTTRKKDTTLLNALLNTNMQPSVTAFDSDDLVVNGLGVEVGDMVLKSRQMEDYDKKRSTIYRELIAQGDVFVQELYKEDFREIPIDQITWDPNKDGISDFSIKRRLQKIFEGPEVRMVNAKKIYLGNIRCQYIEDQSFVAVLNVYPRAQAEARYRNWERWQYVPHQINTLSTWFSDGTTYKDWNLVALNDYNKVAEIMVYWKEKNCFAILLNGVLMLPIDYPLTAISPTGEIPFAQGKFEPISDFAYSKSQPSNVKIDQESIDEFLRLAIEKTRQSFKPPLGNKSKKVYSQNIFLAGKITSDMQDGDLFPIYPGIGSGITMPELSFYNMIKQNIDEKTTSKQFAGESAEGQQTAEEIQTVQQQQLMNLGLSLDGISNLEKRMTWNRIHNIIAHWTRKQDANIDNLASGILEGYKTMSVETTVDNGENGIKIFRQMEAHKRPHIRDHEAEEDKLSKLHKKPVRITYLDPIILSSTRYKWYVQMNPVPKSNDKLSQVLFVNNLGKAIELFGPESINMDYAKQRFAILIKEDYNKFFKKMSVQDMLQKGLNNPEVANAKNAMGGKPNGGMQVKPSVSGGKPALRM
jgi:hypothetical protein